MTQPPSRGVLYPARLPTFTRVPPEPAESAFVVHFWVPEWSIEPGRVSRQQLIGFPAVNLVVMAHEVVVSGPTTRRSHRDLSGTGWGVGALLRPAAVPAIAGDPLVLRDTESPLDAPELVAAVTEAMDARDPHRITRACRLLGAWMLERAGEPSPDALLADELARVIDGDPIVLQLADIAARLNVSQRTVTRLARRFVGVTPRGDDPAAAAAGGGRAATRRSEHRARRGRSAPRLRRPIASEPGLPQRAGVHPDGVSGGCRPAARSDRSAWAVAGTVGWPDHG